MEGILQKRIRLKVKCGRLVPLAKAYMLSVGLTELNQFKNWDWFSWVTDQKLLYLKENNISKIANINDWNLYIIRKFIRCK